LIWSRRTEVVLGDRRRFGRNRQIILVNNWGWGEPLTKTVGDGSDAILYAEYRIQRTRASILELFINYHHLLFIGSWKNRRCE
jgi:hypothetical protein